MPIVKIGPAGQLGVNKDLSTHDLPVNAWTDVENVRFQSGYAKQALGYKEIYPTIPIVPLHIVPVIVSGSRYVVVAGTGKIYCVNGSTWTDITRASGGDYTAGVNEWTSTLLSGIPVLNNGTDAPQFWTLSTGADFAPLTAWPANTTCKSVRAFRNYLIALNVTKAGTNYPYMVKWSDAADAGTVPASWDETDPTTDAGENDVAADGGAVVDGGALRNDFIIYKSNSIWRMSYIGGDLIFSFAPIFQNDGILTKNCWAEIDGAHFVVTGSDIIIHDGQGKVSVANDATRAYFFGDIDADNYGRAFVFKSPYSNEVAVAYPSSGSTYCDKLMVYNTVTKTLSFRSVPNLTHANSGLFEASASQSWDSDTDTWDSDATTWGDIDFTPDSARTVWASADQALYMSDSGYLFDGASPDATLERIGLSFGQPEAVKLVKGIRPRITGETGSTVIVSVGSTTDPAATPTNYVDMTYTIGSTLKCDCLKSGRYIAIKFSTGTAKYWTLESYDVEIDVVSMY